MTEQERIDRPALVVLGFLVGFVLGVLFMAIMASSTFTW